MVAYTVTSVGKYAFGACEYMSGTLAIPDTVKTIAERAFWACRGLTGISTIGGVEKLGKHSFYLDTDKTRGRFPDLSNVTEISEGAFYCSRGLAGEVLLGSGLQIVPKQCFQNSSLDMVTIPRNITKINESAFAGTKLTAFVAPGPIDASSGEQSFLTIDCKNQFKGCSDLKTVVIGKNTKGTNRSDGTILYNVNGCSLFLPNNADWENCAPRRNG